MTLQKVLLALCLAVAVVFSSDWTRLPPRSPRGLALWAALAFLVAGFPYALFRFVRGVVTSETSERLRKNT